MFRAGVLGKTKEATTLKRFSQNFPLYFGFVWGILGPILGYVNLFVENHSVFSHEILHIIFWYWCES